MGAVLTRIFGTLADGYDAPAAAGVTLSGHGDIAVPGNPLLAVLGEPLDAMVQNLGRTDNSYVNLGFGSNKALSQGFTTGSNAGGYELQGIGINIEGSDSNFPDGPTSVSVAVHADSSGQPGAKLFDLVSPTEFAAGHSFFEAPPGTLLTPNTAYVLFWRYNDGTFSRLQKTLSDGEDSGALTGFSIANAFYRGADLSSLSENSNSNALEIAVYGEQATTPTVTAVALTSDPGTRQRPTASATVVAATRDLRARRWTSPAPRSSSWTLPARRKRQTAPPPRTRPRWCVPLHGGRERLGPEPALRSRRTSSRSTAAPSRSTAPPGPPS